MSSTPSPIAEISSGPSKLDLFLEKHGKKLIILAVLIILAILAYIIYAALARNTKQEAGAALLEAKNLAQYQQVRTQWASTPSAQTALPFIAALQWEKTPEASNATLQAFIESNPNHIATPSAQIRLATHYINQQKNSQARHILLPIANAYDEPTSTLACILLGEINRTEGKPQEARAWYEKAITRSKGGKNNFSSLAQLRLRSVETQPPAPAKASLQAPKPSSPSLELPSPPQDPDIAL